MKRVSTILLLICAAAFAQEKGTFKKHEKNKKKRHVDQEEVTFTDTSVRYVQGDAKEAAKAEAEAMAKEKAEKIKANSGTFTDTRDNKTYKTVKIGEQVWFAENLNYNANGSKCLGEGGKVYNPETKKYDITLSNSEIQANCEKYGRLYDWTTAMVLPDSCKRKRCVSQIYAKHKEICPSGWHLPSNADWNTLMKYIGCSDIMGGCFGAGTKLKSKTGWNDYKGKSGNGTDDYGFSALPGSDRSLHGFGGVGYGGVWWIASEDDDDGLNADCRVLNYDSEGVMAVGSNKGFLYSVRCVQDSTAEAKAKAKAKIEKAVSALKAKAKKGSFTDARDGNTYKTVKLDNQTWMAENLNYNANDSKCYENQESNCQKYGRLYNWETAKSACPSGWHLPDTTEWNVLAAAVGEETESIFLKATIGWADRGNGVDAIGFSALPGGLGGSLGNFGSVGYDGYWWSASEGSSYYAYHRYMGYSSERASFGNYDKYRLYSVRCVKD